MGQCIVGPKVLAKARKFEDMFEGRLDPGFDRSACISTSAKQD